MTMLPRHMAAQGVDMFDADCFRVSRAEAVALDPQIRVLLEVTAEGLADAGPRCFGADAASRTGTYVGCMFNDYMSLLHVVHGLDFTGQIMTGAY
jgi:acyl transferase domain-containing protein